jgi:hypothetical protein
MTLRQIDVSDNSASIDQRKAAKWLRDMADAIDAGDARMCQIWDAEPNTDDECICKVDFRHSKSMLPSKSI